MRTVSLLLLLLCLAAPIFANDFDELVVIQDVAEFLDYQRDIRTQIKHGNKFDHIDGVARKRLLGAQNELFAILGPVASIDELSEVERAAVFNAQAVVGAILADAELDRPICSENGDWVHTWFPPPAKPFASDARSRSMGDR